MTSRLRISLFAVFLLAAGFAVAVVGRAEAVTQTSTTPANGQTVQAPSEVVVEFDSVIVQNADTIVVKDKDGDTVAGTVSFDPAVAPISATWTPNAPATVLPASSSPYTVFVTAEDANPFGDPAEFFFVFYVDDTVPDAPDIDSHTDPINIANETTVEVTGSAEPGSEVEVTLANPGGDSVVVTQTTDVTNGSFSVSLDASSLDDGTNLELTATATDLAGNESDPTTIAGIVKDTARPFPPDLDPLPTVDDTNHTAVPITATGFEDSLTLKVTVDDEDPDTASVVVVVADNGGADTDAAAREFAFVADLSSLTDGELTATATLTDPAGNESNPSSPARTTTKNLGPPELLAVSPTADGTIGPVTEVTAKFTEPLDTDTSSLTVRKNADTNPEGTLTLGGTTTFRDGNRTIVFTPDQALGEAGNLYEAKVIAVDTQGSALGDPYVWNFTVDATPPTNPVITGYTDPVTASTDDTKFQVTGTSTGDPNIEVKVSDQSGNDVSVVVTDSGDGTADGNWTATLDTSGLADGTWTIQVVASDDVGNKSGTVTASATADRVNPDTPVIVDATDPVDANNEKVFEASGTAAADVELVKVRITDGGGTFVDASTAPAGDDSWSVTADVSALDDGPLNVVVIGVDGVGNQSGPSVPFTVTKRSLNFAVTMRNINGTYTVLVGDFNGDGIDDFFWQRPGAASDVLWIGHGDLTYTKVQYAIGGSYRPIVGDFNGDGMDDILWYRPGADSDSLWISNGDGTFERNALTISGDYLPFVGDFNGDGIDDIVWYRPGEPADIFWLNNADGTYTAFRYQVNGAYFVVIGDLDGDGLDDIFWYGPADAPDSQWLSNGDGTFSRSRIVVSDTYVPAFADIDGDGSDDLIQYRPGAGQDIILFGNGGTLLFDQDGFFRMLIGDFDGDGRADFFWYAAGDTVDEFWITQ